MKQKLFLILLMLVFLGILAPVQAVKPTDPVWSVYASGVGKRLKPGMDPCWITYTVAFPDTPKIKINVKSGLMGAIASGLTWREASAIKRRHGRYFDDQPDGIYKLTSCDASKNRRRDHGKVCRNLYPGEKYYSSWVSCCDLKNGKSRWKNRSTGRSSDWSGSCKYWGVNKRTRVNPIPPRPVGRTCRNLVSGDKYYGGWISCCDLKNGKSRWKQRGTNKSSDWNGSCKSWGIKHRAASPVPPRPVNRRVCRNLRPGDKYYKGWISCCDVGTNKSRWKRRGNQQSGLWNGNCKSWGIK